MDIWIINGPNLNLLGKRSPEIYGSTTLSQLIQGLELKYHSTRTNIHSFQSNHEGHIIDQIHTIGFLEDTYGVINAGGLTHTSVSLRDAIEGVETPFVEVHISDIHNREEFRKQNYLSDVVKHTVVGRGIKGYDLAVDWILDRYSRS